MRAIRKKAKRVMRANRKKAKRVISLSKIRKLNTLKSLSKMIALVLVYSRQKLTKSKVKKFVVKMKKYFFAKKTIEKINDFIRQISAVNT